MCFRKKLFIFAGAKGTSPRRGGGGVLTKALTIPDGIAALSVFFSSIFVLVVGKYEPIKIQTK